MLKNYFQCPINLYAENESGDKHCHKCAKNVIDLRGLSDEEVDRIGAGKGEFCGIIQSKRLVPNYNKLAVFALAFLLASGALMLPNDIHAQDGLIKSDSISVNQNSYWVKGIVSDKEDGELLPFVNVVINQNGRQINGGSTNFDGEFKIEIPKSKLDSKIDKLELRVTFVGYKPYEKVLDLKEDEVLIELDFSLDDEIEILGGLHYYHEPMDPPGVTTFKRHQIKYMPGGYPQ